MSLLVVKPLILFTFPLLLKDITITGSLIGGIQQTQEMLEFCAKHSVVSDVEVIQMNKVNEAFERVLK
jgi:uncharacterized zinc-type alcohol dehydrogenase-like protein